VLAETPLSLGRSPLASRLFVTPCAIAGVRLSRKIAKTDLIRARAGPWRPGFPVEGSSESSPVLGVWFLLKLLVSRGRGFSWLFAGTVAEVTARMSEKSDAQIKAIRRRTQGRATRTGPAPQNISVLSASSSVPVAGTSRESTFAIIGLEASMSEKHGRSAVLFEFCLRTTILRAPQTASYSVFGQRRRCGEVGGRAGWPQAASGKICSA
jgi:hypothetical protein